MKCEFIEIGSSVNNLKFLGDRLSIFAGDNEGAWKVLSIKSVKGESLPHAERMTVYHAPQDSLFNVSWILTGTASNRRYENSKEKEDLIAKQPKLGRPEAICGALIPIKKSAAWWELSQEERRAIFETKSRHIEHSIQYLPAIARRLHHCRDLGGPFDFLTWFEYAPEHAHDFEELVAYLRQTEEWNFVEREVDIRLTLE